VTHPYERSMASQDPWRHRFFEANECWIRSFQAKSICTKLGRDYFSLVERSDIPFSELTQIRERKEFEIQTRSHRNYLLFFPSPSMKYINRFCRAFRLSNLLIKLLNYLFLFLNKFSLIYHCSDFFDTLARRACKD
jgi:hypothetical protein